MPRSSPALRRYPALSFVLGAGLLATLLPSALRIPLAGPPQAAELAPVSGDSGVPGNLGGLGGTGSNGLGGGAGPGGRSSAAGGDDPPPPPGGKGTNPASKRCVGKAPARQTEDPLSPHCVPYFKGDNGGATAPGVTGTEVRVVVFYDCNEEPAFEIDYGKDANHASADPAVRAYQRFFNERYQTYGRFVRFVAVKHSCGQDVSVGQRRSHVDDVVDRHTPFAVITQSSNSISSTSLDYDAEFARNRVVAIPSSNRPRRLMQEHAPHLLTFDPDVDDDIEQSAAFMCQKLVGFPAVYSGNVTDRGKTRKFGFVHEERDPQPLIEALGRRCGVRQQDVVVFNAEGGQTDEAAGVNVMRDEGVTTVVRLDCYNCSFNWVPQANAAQCYPEWFLPGSVPDTIAGRLYPQLEWANAFITTYKRRQGPRPAQPWYQGYREGCPECGEPRSGASMLFDRLTLLFWGIQASGPRLTPANLDRGLHALPARPSKDPFTPAAYFAPGNYSFVKDAMVAWWDPSAAAPDGQRGCWRLAESGRRRRGADWTRGQLAIRTDDMPCQVP